MIIDGKEQSFDCRVIKSGGNEVLGIIRNMTERKNFENELQLAKEKAEQSEKAKELFLANTSHEIRTPMNAVIGITELLKKTKLSEEQMEYVNIIEQSSENLPHIINDILDFSKIESDKITYEKTVFDLKNMLVILQKLMLPEAKEKMLIFSLNCPVCEQPLLLKGDPVRLNQILLNLVRNAIKFTHKGSINMTVEEFAEEEKQMTIRFSVADTGIGIPKEKQEEIFSEFSQADVSTTRLYGGTGLGLSISKKLVEAMGGKLEVKDESGVRK